MKPIPEPVYPCKYCADEYSWPASDLNWSELDEAWVCDLCWDDRDIEEEKGVCLADEIKKVEATHDADVINEALSSLANQFFFVQLSNEDGDVVLSVSDLEYYVNQLYQKAQEAE